MKVYLDASVILAAILGESHKFSHWDRITKAATSELSWVESCRTLDRFRLERKLDDQDLAVAQADLKRFFSELTVFEISREIVLAASTPQTTVLGTLDAIHLHTALLWKAESNGDIVLATFDKQLKRAALSRHFEVLE